MRLNRIVEFLDDRFRAIRLNQHDQCSFTIPPNHVGQQLINSGGGGLSMPNLTFCNKDVSVGLRELKCQSCQHR
jgi:hypothetical protein